jgi:Lysine-specific metallo-endopeptidase
MMSKGELTGKFSKAGLAVVEQDARSRNVYYEGFKGGNLSRARHGWADTLRCGEKAVWGMKAAAAAVSSGASVTSPELTRYTTWFGTANHGELMVMVDKAETMLDAMRTRNITLVLRENQVMHYVNGDDPLAPMEDDDLGTGTFGYVWGSGPRHNGSGMRVICCDQFLLTACQYEGAAATIYHEITHKVLGTSDKSSAGVTTYGIPDCKALASSDPASARNVADNWCYYAISFLKAI